MLIFAFRLGRFEVVALRETAPARSLLSRSASGEVVLDLPGVSLTMCRLRDRSPVR